MEFNGKKIRIGDVVDVDGQKRIVTRIERDTFFSNPYTEDVAKIEMESVVIDDPKEKPAEAVINAPEEPEEEEKVSKPRRRGKNK